MKTYDELQRKVMQDTLSLRRELEETWNKKMKIEKKQKTIRGFRMPLAILAGMIMLGIMCWKLDIFRSMGDWYFIDELKYIPTYVVTTGFVADVLVGAVGGFIVWAISYDIISLFIPDNKKTKKQIDIIKKSIEEKCHLILEPIALSLFEKTLDQFVITNKKHVIEELRKAINKQRLIEHVYADALPINLYIKLNEDLVEYKDNQYILDMLSVKSNTYPNKLGEYAFFVKCWVEKIEKMGDEKNFSLTKQTLVFQIDLE